MFADRDKGVTNYVKSGKIMSGVYEGAEGEKRSLPLLWL